MIGLGFLREVKFLVVRQPPLRVAQGFVGSVERLSASECCTRIGIQIWMVLLGENAIGGANLCVRAVAVEAESGIVTGFY